MNAPLILDSTLREGEQTPGVCFPLHVKTAIATLLETLGVDIIEAGHPMVSPSTRQGVVEVASRVRSARVAAHARTSEQDIEAALSCGVGMVGIFYCVSDERLQHHDTTLPRAIDQICAIIRRCRELAPDIWIRYTPEDTVRSPWENVLQAASAAAEAGADIISVADTTGSMIPDGKRSMERYVARLAEKLQNCRRPPRIAVHCHNDRGLALANALDGWRGGAAIIDASVMGLGERCGIVDLASLIAVLHCDFALTDRWQPSRLPELYQLVSRFARLPIPVNAPVTGANAFTHCAGVHTQAALKNPAHYESLPPAVFGRKRQVALDHMSGLSSLRYALDEIKTNIDDPKMLQELLRDVKAIGLSGRVVENSELTLLAALHQRRKAG